MHRILLLCLLVICTATLHSELNTKIDLSGYYENRFYLLHNRYKNADDKFNLSDFNRLRLIFKNSPADKVTLNLAVDLFTLHGATSLSPSAPGLSDVDKTTKINLDRAYISLYFKNADLTIGKQRFPLGVAWLWSPLDVFNRVNPLEPNEEKPGANGAKLMFSLGSFADVTAIFAPEEKFGRSRYALRMKRTFGQTDIALTYIRDGIRDTDIYGLDLRGENIVGWWLEGGYFRIAGEDEYKYTIGTDYTIGIGNGLYIMGEYHYDSSGKKKAAEYDLNDFITGRRTTLGRAYIMTMLRYPLSPLLSCSVSVIRNWYDKSTLINPSLQYDLFENVSLSTGIYLTAGSRGEYTMQKKNIFYIWLKASF